MDDLVSRRRALAGRADLMARAAGRPMTRDERRLANHYDRTLGIERRSRMDVSDAIMRWCEARAARHGGQMTPMTDDERAEYRALVAEHRAAPLTGASPDASPNRTQTPTLNLRRRRAALL
ncbi:hypothetical protein [Cellulomonas sp. PSBB021]|uniref:hypothetical protein n=1 Tax=Cellulomonas sp. PSBB021 TaxID=2003551 RepID=UPI000B8DA5B8|nr:hypothetical protein [Cellulomonas sp. PSBB021]ASR56294.1 hypothetical protein CBP52_15635 [Cellulomonas sp. PSBB021]